MKNVREFLAPLLQNIDTDTSPTFKINFDLTEDRLNEIISSHSWWVKTEKEANNLFVPLTDAELFNVYKKTFPESIVPKKRVEAEQALIDNYVEEMMAQDKNFPLHNENSKKDAFYSLVTTESTYRDAQQTARYLLEISKNNKGVSNINPNLKFDDVNKKFYLELTHIDALKLHEVLSHKHRNTENSRVSKMIGQLIVPLNADNYYEKFRKLFAEDYLNFQKNYPYHNESDIETLLPDNIVRNKLDLPTADGIPLSGIKVYQKGNQDSKAYVVHCHGNLCHYEQLIHDLEALAQNTNCKIVSFDYRGYALSLGNATCADDLYEDAFAYAKHCVDAGADYILLDGVSLGGAVAAKTANSLRAYCEATKKHVQIEHHNAMSFSSTKDFVLGIIKEGDFQSKRAPHGLFRDILASILSPFANLILRVSNWILNPLAEIQKMPKDSYEVVNAKGDAVIGTFASVEYQLRDSCRQEIENCDEQINLLANSIREIKQQIVAEVNAVNQQVKLADYAFGNYSSTTIKSLLTKLAPQLKLDNLINQLNDKEFSLSQISLTKKLKQNRLMATDETKNYVDGQGDNKSNTHSASINHINTSAISATEKQAAFIATHQSRNNLNLRDNQNKNMLDSSLSLFNPLKIKTGTKNFPLRITSTQILLQEIERLEKIFTRDRNEELFKTLFYFKVEVGAGFYSEACDVLRKCQSKNRVFTHFRDAALSYLTVAENLRYLSKAMG